MATAAEDHIGWHFLKSIKGNGCYIGSPKLERRRPMSPMSLDFWCDIGMVESEVGA